MKLNHNPQMTFEAMTQALQEELPQYQVELLKNPLMGFQYVQVRKSGAVGTWVRIFDKKDEVRLINGMPAWWARALFGGVLLLLFVWGSMNRVRKETADVLMRRFGTDEK
jgi:hypothetical protein